MNPVNPPRDTTGNSYLALGDSYTIGEMVPDLQNYPNQVTLFLRKQGIFLEDPQIIARTGWTTNDLLQAIGESHILTTYSLVTLLIGVNNQYQGRSIAEFQIQFTQLLKEAIAFSGGRPNHVIVLSIPDWGVTPFAVSSGASATLIGQEIDLFNESARQIADSQQVHYLDITQDSRQMGRDPSLVAGD
ncbi:MAG: GDSL-type esterase/lipase family protein, partial [Chitinophagaceae bacterium]